MSGLEARLSDTELLEECVQWWSAGFTTSAFRSYLSGMVGLGVLARNTGGLGWRLRGTAVLNVIGTVSDVENRLLQLTPSRCAASSPPWPREKKEDGRNFPLAAGRPYDR